MPRISILARIKIFLIKPLVIFYLTDIVLLTLNQGDIKMQTLTLNPIEQTNPSSLVKSTYGFISTADLLQTFAAQGWAPVSKQVAKTKVEARQGYQKHIVRLEHPNFQSIKGLTESNRSRPQLCLLNSHDGSAALRLFYGVLRIACLNGIIAGSVLKSFRAVHSANNVAQLEHGIAYMTSGIGELAETVERLAKSRFSLDAQYQLVHQLVDLRLANVKNIVDINYNSATRLVRPEDNSSDAYTIFNRLQESLVRGGIEYTYNKNIVDSQGQVIDVKQVTTKTKRLSSVVSQLNINRTAFDLAVKLAA